MHRLEVTRDVARPPDEVFAYLTDFSHLRDWWSLAALRVEPAGPLRVGSVIHAEVKGPGRPMRFVNEVTQLDPAAFRYDDRAVSGTFLIESGWAVEPTGTGSRIHWTTHFQPHGPLRLLAPALGWLIRLGQLADLETLKRRLEQGTAAR